MNKTRKRLTSCRFMEMYGRFLKPGGTVHLKTDSRFLYTYTRTMVLHNQLSIVNDFSDLYHSDFEDALFGIRTYYEERFMAHQIPIKYLSFLLDNKNPLAEPEIDIPRDIYHNAGRSVKLYENDQQAPPNLNI